VLHGAPAVLRDVALATNLGTLLLILTLIRCSDIVGFHLLFVASAL